jgi:Ino eighty subunit 2
VFTDNTEAGTKKALVLTEAERLQRREESARRRKRQMEQKLQDEQVC